MASLIQMVTATLLVLSTVPGVAQRAQPPTASSAAIERWQPIILQASQRFGIPEAWIRAVMQAESGGHTHLNGHPIVSRAGAMGLMQLMPGTWSAMRTRYGLGADPQDPHDNIMAGTAYLRAMYDSFGYPGLFAAYNAGPGRYSQHLRTGHALPQETQDYIKQLAGNAAAPSLPPAILSGNQLFFRLGTPSKAAGDADSTAPHDSIIPSASASAEGTR